MFTRFAAVYSKLKNTKNTISEKNYNYATQYLITFELVPSNHYPPLCHKFLKLSHWLISVL